MTIVEIDDQLIKFKNYAVRGGNHYTLKHCETTECNSYILYDYSLYRLGSLFGVRHNCTSGYVIFDYPYV